MTQILDFRNAKYQGQTLNNLPHGLGIMIDYKNIFCLAQWNQGVIEGKTLIVFGDSKIFYGTMSNKMPIDLCTYHLKDKCQVFCNFQNNKISQKQSVLKKQKPKNNKLVALLPTFNMIIRVQGQNQQQLQIKGQKAYRQDDFQQLKQNLQKMLEWRFKPQQLQSFLSLQNFIRSNFASKREYSDLLDIVQITTPDGKQMFLTLKNKKSNYSLGIRIQNCMQSINGMTNLHNDGNSYIIKALGFFTKQGILQYGLKNIKTLIKGNVKQQAIYNDEKTIIRYETDSARPKQCSLNILNHLKKSPNYINEYLKIKHLNSLQAQCLNINFSIKQTQTKKYAQLILQNPKQLNMYQKEKIQQTRLRKMNNGSIQKNISRQNTPNPYIKQTQNYQQKNEQLQKVKQQIYRSVSKKKINGKTNSPFIHGGTNLSSSPQKQIKPAQLTNVKPILQIYKNTADKSFYNSINKNDSSFINNKHAQGYKFTIPTNNESQSQPYLHKPLSNINLHPLPHSEDYFKNLQSRRRLYEQVQPNNNNIIERTKYPQQGYHREGTNKKKFSYLPEQQESNRSVNLNYRKNIPYDKYNQPSYINENSYKQGGSSYKQPYSYEHAKSNENYFRSHNRSPYRQKSIQKYDDQAGKLGRRTQKKQYSNKYLNYQDRSRQQFNPIIVPQFKISQTNIGSNYSRDQRYKKRYEVDPTINYARQNKKYDDRDNRFENNEDNYLRQRQIDRSRSPVTRRKKILSDNPFDV